MSFWRDEDEDACYLFREVFKAAVILFLVMPVVLFLIFLLLMAILTSG